LLIVTEFSLPLAFILIQPEDRNYNRASERKSEY
jgi:hypothetical protein